MCIRDRTWNACVDYQADEDSLGTYGLDIPAATITVEYTCLLYTSRCV